MAPQLSYSINLQAVSYPGQPVDISSVNDNLTGLAVAAAIPYGVLGVLDSGNSSDFGHIGVKVPAAASDITTLGKPLGVVVADQARAQDPSVALPTYPQYSAVPLKRVGRIWVAVENAVVNGGQAFVRFSSSANGTQLGAFRADADTISSVDHAAALAHAYFRSNQATPGGYAVVELMLN